MKLMKKSLFILLTLLLTGCTSTQSAPPVADSTPPPSTANDSSSIVPNQKTLTEEEIKAIVLAEVPNGKIIEIDSDLNTLSPNYDVKVIEGNTEYEFEIDATTGTIRSTEKDFESNTKPVTPAKVSVEEAKAIALKEVPDAEIISIEYEEDEPLVHYDICLKSGDYEYDLEIDATTGDILKTEKELLN